MLDIDGSDAGTLSRFGIHAETFPDARDNRVRLDPRGRSLRGLTLAWAGHENLVELRGTRFPDGRISCVGTGSTTSVHADAEVALTAWLFSGARFVIDRPLALFGLEASVFEDTTLTIDAGCLFAKDVEVWTADHHSLVDLATAQQINPPADVRIGPDTWVSNGAMVLKGVQVGRGAVIAARALVVADVPAFELWGGVPAKCLRREVSWLPAHPAPAEQIAELVRRAGAAARRA